MSRYIVLLIMLLLCTSYAVAQTDDWRSNADGTMEFNCEVVNTVWTAFNAGDFEAITETGDTSIARFENGAEVGVTEYIGNAVIGSWSADGNATITFDSIFKPALEACDSAQATESDTADVNGKFSVKVNGNINVRSCAGTDCEVVGTASDGSLLTVIREDGDWYEVKFEDGTAFIASWLTIRGPDAVIETNEPYLDTRTGCIVAFDVKRGDMDMNLILAGDRRDDLFVDLFRPNETRPLRVEGQFDKTFIDTGAPYIQQYYSWNVGWPQGTYQVAISLGDQTSKLAWELGERGDYNIYVVCN